MLNRYIYFLVIFSLAGQQICNAIEDLLKYDQTKQIPCVSLESIDLNTCTLLHEFKLESIPVAGNHDLHTAFHQHAERKVYATEDKKFVFKIWQKNYFHAQQFLAAYETGFYKGIARIAALIFDKDGDCRGYITPYLIDRMLHRREWDAYGFVLEKNKIGASVFASYDKQPQMYKNLFDLLLKKAEETDLVMPDFCPNNCGVDPQTGILYLFDLEDVAPVNAIQHLINEIYVYNPSDYIAHIAHVI